MRTKNVIKEGNDPVAFHEAIASKWKAGYKKGTFQRRLQAYASIFDRLVRAETKWLDLGCGAGVLTKELLTRGVQVTALDGSRSMLNAAIYTTGEQAAEVEWRQGDVRDLSFSPNAFFDGVLCSSVIEYLPEPDTLLAEIARVLKHGGYCIVSVPPTWAVTRTLQKGYRFLTGVCGIKRYTYLDISKLELAPSRISLLFERHALLIDRMDRFDPIPAIMLCRWVRPALLIILAIKV